MLPGRTDDKARLITVGDRVALNFMVSFLSLKRLVL